MNKGGAVMQRFSLLSHSKKVVGSNCEFFSCLHGFSPGALAGYIIWRLLIACRCECDREWLFVSMC